MSLRVILDSFAQRHILGCTGYGVQLLLREDMESEMQAETFLRCASRTSVVGTSFWGSSLQAAFGGADNCPCSIYVLHASSKSISHEDIATPSSTPFKLPKVWPSKAVNFRFLLSSAIV